MKKLLSYGLVSAVALSLASPMSAHADTQINQEENTYQVETENKDSVVVTENEGVSTTNPEITPYGTSKPSSSWSLYSKGRYDFKGSSKYNTLYSEYLLYGKSSTKIEVKNKDTSEKLHISIKQVGLIDSEVWSESVSPGSTLTAFPELNSKEKYYLVFKAPCSFSGYIE